MLTSVYFSAHNKVFLWISTQSYHSAGQPSVYWRGRNSVRMFTCAGTECWGIRLYSLWKCWCQMRRYGSGSSCEEQYFANNIMLEYRVQICVNQILSNKMTVPSMTCICTCYQRVSRLYIQMAMTCLLALTNEMSQNTRTLLFRHITWSMSISIHEQKSW